MGYTDIIVGAGSAGCVLANRLSADDTRDVLLVEAGEFFRSAQTPPAVASANNFAVLEESQFVWPIEAALTARRPSQPFQQGRGVGGSSSINNTWAVRARRGDLARWHEGGCTSITWPSLLEHYRRIERDLDFNGSDIHGNVGPLVVSRAPEAEWTATDHAFRDACQGHGLPESPDVNDPDATGLSRLAMTVHQNRRVSAHDAFLDPVVDRPNLTVMSNTLVERVVLHRTRATGVIAVVDGAETELVADNIILAAGAVQSPSILLRSGIGPTDAMTSAGVKQFHRLDWVGRNLAEHPMISVFIPLIEEAQAKDLDGRQVNVLARPRGGAQGDTWHVSCLSLTPFGGTIAAPFVALMDTASRGTVTLAPDGRSHMRVNALSEQGDIDRMWEGFELMLELVHAPPLRAITAAAPFTVTGRLDLAGARADRATFLHQQAMPYRHLAGTCRMSDDPQDGVVDNQHRVHGVDNLRVIDASVLPDATSSNLNLTVIALADRAATNLLEA